MSNRSDGDPPDPGIQDEFLGFRKNEQQNNELNALEN